MFLSVLSTASCRVAKPIAACNHVVITTASYFAVAGVPGREREGSMNNSPWITYRPADEMMMMVTSNRTTTKCNIDA